MSLIAVPSSPLSTGCSAKDGGLSLSSEVLNYSSLILLRILLGSLCFTAWSSIRGTLLLLKDFPIYAAVSSQSKRSLCVKGRGAMRKDQWLDFYLPATQIGLG